MPWPSPLARLAKDGERVLCFDSDCGAWLGTVIGSHPDEVLHLVQGYGVGHRAIGAGARWIIRAQGEPVEVPATLTEDFFRPGPRLRAHFPRRTPGQRHPLRLGAFRPFLPSKIECYKCHRLQWLKEQALHVGEAQPSGADCFRTHPAGIDQAKTTVTVRRDRRRPRAL